MSDSKIISSYSPEKKSIGELLSLTSPSIIVPEWQRNYSWKTENIETFWNDIVSFIEREGNILKNEYFLGSIVIVKTHDGLLNLLDGQQRMATSSILVSSIRDFIKSYKSDASNFLQSSYLVGHNYVTDQSIQKLQLNYYDREFFRKLISVNRTGDYIKPVAEISSHHLIEAARRKFDEYLVSYTEGLDPKTAFEKVMKVSKCLLEHMTVIAITSNNEDSAAEVFETLNDRGISLSTPDLLRNLVIRRASEDKRELIVRYWSDVVSFENDTRIKNFLPHYWISLYGDIKTQSLYREIKQVVVDKSIDSLELSQQLSRASDTYRKILGADFGEKEVDGYLHEVLAYGSSANILFPAILGVLETLEGPDRIKAIHNLLTVFVRHSIILGRENSKLENVLYRATRNLRGHKLASMFSDEILIAMPTDDEVVRGFLKLEIKQKESRRALLCRLEMLMRDTNELVIASPDSVHVEHIYPQRPDQSQLWAEHDMYVDRIGNMTLLSSKLNRQAQNYNFIKKRKFFEISQLKLSLQLLQYDNWSPETVDARQATLAELAPKAFAALR